MKRCFRIFLEVFGPPLLGALCHYVSMVIQQPESNSAIGLMLVAVLGLMTALPLSLTYAAIMEWAFYRGLHPGSWKTVVLSAVLGTVAGVIIHEGIVPHMFRYMILYGFIAGTVVGFLVRFVPPTFKPKVAP